MSANLDRMAYVGVKPWHREGVFLGDSDVDAKAMVAASGIGYRVEKRPLFARVQGKYTEVPGAFATIRQDNGAILGTVTERYEVLQNIDAVRFVEKVIGKGQAVYHTAGSLGVGEKAWVLLRLPQTEEIVRGDPVEHYLLAANAHDGAFAFRIMQTPIRVVCENTLNLAMGASGGAYRLSHYQNINARLDAKAARELVGLAGQGFEAFTEAAKALASQRLSERELQAFLQRLLPLPTQLLLTAPKGQVPLLLPEPKPEALAPEYRVILRHRDEVRRLVEVGKGNTLPGVRGTKWAAFNGVAEYTDYVQGRDKGRAESLLFGNGAALKQRAWELLTARAPRTFT